MAFNKGLLISVVILWIRVGGSWSLLTLHTSGFSCKSLLQIRTVRDLGNDWLSHLTAPSNDILLVETQILRCWIGKKNQQQNYLNITISQKPSRRELLNCTVYLFFKQNTFWGKRRENPPWDLTRTLFWGQWNAFTKVIRFHGIKWLWFGIKYS